MSWIPNPRSALCRPCAEAIPKFRDKQNDFICFHGTAMQVVKSAGNGCPFCRLLTDALHLYKYAPMHGDPWDMTPSYDKPSSESDTAKTYGEVSESRVSSYTEYKGSARGSVIQIDVWQQTRAGGIPFPRLLRMAKLQLSSLNDDLHYFRDVLPPEEVRTMQEPGSACYNPSAVAKGCLASCDANHDCYSSLEDGMLPTRVIDVGETPHDQPWLFVPNTPTRAKYIALSYCWGQTNTFVVTPTNVNQLQQGFPTTALPLTLRDVVELTRDLGLRYLWIDALCILQGDHPDSRRDWAVEFPRMHEYYGNAYLTVSAAGACDADGGLFAPQVEYGRILADTGGYFSANRYDPGPKLTGQPINARGWTMQEALMSPRMLVFSSLGLAWQCRRTGLGRAVDASGTVDAEVEHAYTLPAPPAKPDWMRIVEDYSHRKLTSPGDKLPAIASLAHLYGTTTAPDDRYLAGLWKADLLRQLLWHIDLSERSFRPPKYRAPTWSWAAIDGLVQYVHVGSEEDDRNTRWVASLVDHKTVPVDPSNPFGPLDYAEITVRGPLLKASYPSVSRTEAYGYIYTLGHAKRIERGKQEQKKKPDIGYIDYDVHNSPDDLLRQLAQEKLLYCLMLRAGDDFYGALGLLPVAQPDPKAPKKYRRVGVVTVKKANIFEKAPVKTVVIV
ncbi:heterokaryon incompatibility protein [Colletotrichum sojae]|uniref:Heterokaryon incompatibility protein n=1 Tax=Colletotrichum sojae TaxID=2175907 RepID=A0A8H6MMH9_9PEZI|nr:heterokaryon incompatibility protein [Colletotrichum sojae]